MIKNNLRKKHILVVSIDDLSLILPDSKLPFHSKYSVMSLYNLE